MSTNNDDVEIYMEITTPDIQITKEVIKIPDYELIDVDSSNEVINLDNNAEISFFFEESYRNLIYYFFTNILDDDEYEDNIDNSEYNNFHGEHESLYMKVLNQFGYYPSNMDQIIECYASICESNDKEIIYIVRECFRKINFNNFK